MTTLSFLFLSSSTAVASEPGETYTWANEDEGGDPVQAGGDMVEARNPNTGDLMQVWRGWDNNNLYVSVNHGSPARLEGAASYVTPAIAWINSGFRVFHTGTNGSIFYAGVTINRQNGVPNIDINGWRQVPHTAVTPNTRSVAVVGLPNDGIYLAYRGASSADIWGMFYNNANGQWDLPSTTFGSTSDSAPALAYSSNGQYLMLAYRGLDNQVNIIRQRYGTGVWGNRAILGGGFTTDAQPALAMASNGQGQIAARETGSGRLALATIFESGGSYSWGYEVNNFIARYGPVVVIYGLRAYLIATSTTGYVLWKQSRQF